jgi:hypothetical protein
MSESTLSTSLTRRKALGGLVLFCTPSLAIGGTRARANETLAQSLDFTLRNRLGLTIESVFVSPHRSNSWEEDVLGVDTLSDGRDVRIRFPRSSQDDLWDLRVRDTNGRNYDWTSGFNLRRISSITVYFRNGQAFADSE